MIVLIYQIHQSATDAMKEQPGRIFLLVGYSFGNFRQAKKVMRKSSDCS